MRAVPESGEVPVVPGADEGLLPKGPPKGTLVAFVFEVTKSEREFVGMTPQARTVYHVVQRSADGEMTGWTENKVPVVPMTAVILDSPDELQQIVAARALEAPGPTHEFPDGKIVPEDEGAVTLTIGVTPEGTIILNFGSPVAWVGFGPEEAEHLAMALMKHAADLRQRFYNPPDGRG